MIYITVPLDVSHDRTSFTCGKPLLDLYLQKQARQEIKRKLSACFILPSQNQIKAYYTLSAASVERQVLPDEIIKKLPPSYIDLPAVLLGRLAVSNSYHRQGLGEAMLIDALKRSYYASSQISSMAVLVDPLDKEAKQFYEKYSFIHLPGSGKMFLPMAAIAQLF